MQKTKGILGIGGGTTTIRLYVKAVGLKPVAASNSYVISGVLDELCKSDYFILSGWPGTQQ